MPRKDAPKPPTDESPPIDLRALFGAMSDAVLVIDRQGRWLWAAPTLAYQSPRNRERLDFLIGKTFHQVEPEQADRLLAVVHAALDTGATQQVEYDVTRDGITVWFAAAVSRIDDDRVVWVARNVTDRVRARQTLEERVEERTRDLETLLDVSRTVASTLDLREVIGRLLDQAKTLIPYNGASVNLLEGNELVVLDAIAPTADYLIGARFPVDFESLIWKRTSSGRSMIIADMLDQNDPGATAYMKSTRDAGHADVEAIKRIRSWMSVPLIRQGVVIGTLSMSRPEPNFFTEEHARLAMAVAGQAAVAIENARLFEQTQHRERQLAALLEVSRTLASTLDAGEVLGAIVDQLGAITEHTGASVLLIRDDAFEFVEARSITGARAERGARIPFDVAPALSNALRQGETVIIDDVKADEPMAAGYRAAIGSLGLLDEHPFSVIRSWMAVPLALKDRVLGVLTISWTEPSYFTEDHARVARVFAGQAAVAIENARLFEQKEVRARELSALFEVSRALSSTLELQPLLELMLDQLRTLVHYEGAGISLVNGDHIVQLAVRRPAEYADLPGSGPTTTAETFGPVWERLSQGETVAIDDVLDDSLAAQLFRRSWGGDLRGTAVEYIRSMVIVPLVTREEVIGTLNLAHSEPAHFKNEHVELVKAVAAPAAAAIANARLFEQAQRLAAVEERQRLARELHDSVSQALYGIALGARTARTILDRDPVKAIEPVEYVLSLAEAGLAEMRALIFELRPESLETEGIVAALNKQIAATSTRYEITITADLCDEPEISLDHKEVLYRIAQEALHNTIKHARATSVRVSLAQVDGRFSLTINDDGVGFDPAGDFPGHLGLKSMRERATQAGGDLSIESKPGAGTTVTAAVPAR